MKILLSGACATLCDCGCVRAFWLGGNDVTWNGSDVAWNGGDVIAVRLQCPVTVGMSFESLVVRFWGGLTDFYVAGCVLGRCDVATRRCRAYVNIQRYWRVFVILNCRTLPVNFDRKLFCNWMYESTCVSKAVVFFYGMCHNYILLLSSWQAKVVMFCHVSVCQAAGDRRVTWCCTMGWRAACSYWTYRELLDQKDEWSGRNGVVVNLDYLF
jgi:hypothetical protein